MRRLKVKLLWEVPILKWNTKMKIKAYLKPHCGWSMGVRAIFQKHNLQYEDIDVINNPGNYAEMVRKSGQPLSPCVEIDGIMLADVSGEEVEAYMLSNVLVKANDSSTGIATDRGCSDEQHEQMRREQESKPMRFF